MAIGQNVITGYGGMLSLTQAGFFAIGSYATAILTTQFGWSFWATLPVAFIISALFGWLLVCQRSALRVTIWPSLHWALVKLYETS